jgi:hypothetical protein
MTFNSPHLIINFFYRGGGWGEEGEVTN